MQDYILSRFNFFPLDTEGLTPENLLERTRRDFKHIPGSDTLVVCLPAWNQPLWSWYLVKKHIMNSGSSYIVYEFPRPILSDQMDLTRKCFETIDRTVREDIKKLKSEYGYSKCVVIAMSLGSSYAPMVYKNNPDVTDVVLIAPGENLARDMWHGYRTQHLRKSYQRRGIELPELEEAWRSLASEYNMPAPNTRIALHYGKEDQIIPYRLSSTLPVSMEKAGLRPTVKAYRFSGHYAVSYGFLLLPGRFIYAL